MTEKQKLFQELNDKMVKDLGIKDMEKENECKPLTKSQSDWYEYFTDYIQEIDHNKYNQACEYADNKTKD